MSNIEIDPEDRMRLFELLHGTHLAERLLDVALKSGAPNGEPASADLFEKYPELGKAADTALEAVHDLYQVIGRHWGSDPAP